MKLSESDNFISVIEAAIKTGTTAHWVRHLIRTGRLPGEKLFGKYWAVKKEDLSRISQPVIGRPRIRKERVKKAQVK